MRSKRRLRRVRMMKEAQSSTDGILSNHPVSLETADVKRRTERSKSQLDDGKYNLQFENSEYKPPEGYKESTTLSTRYVPGMPGVQAQRVTGNDNVFKDPHSGKIFDYNEGFSEDNVVYNPQGVHYQSSYMYSYASDIAKDFKSKGLYKEARLLEMLFKK
jgi:hypothetical protein